MLNVKVVTWSLASFTTVTYVFCVIYGLIVPESLHMSAFLGQMLPGFEWLSAWAFVIGVVEAFLYGAYAGVVFTPLVQLLRQEAGEPKHSRRSELATQHLRSQ